MTTEDLQRQDAPLPGEAEVLAAIDREELISLALDLANIDSPSGQEKPVSDFILQWLTGNGLRNDKGPLACTLIAAKAIRKAGVPLPGDLIVTGVCGEIGQEPVDEFTAPAYLSKEVGTRYLITHGIVGDFAFVAEATDFGVT